MDTEKIIAIIADVLEMPTEQIRAEDSFFDDLGADSLELTQIIMKVEDTFMISIEEQALASVVTVSDAVRIVKEAKQA